MTVRPLLRTVLLRTALATGLVLGVAGCGGGGSQAAPATHRHATDVSAAHSAAASHPSSDTSGMDDSGDMSGMDMSSGSASAAKQPSTHGFRLNVPLARPEFVLTDTRGHRYDFGARTRGRATLLYFGYTNCP